MESEEKVQDLVWLEVWRQHRKDLLKEAKTAQLTREIRRGRKTASKEWRIKLGGWMLQLRRIPEYEVRPAAKS